MIKLEMRSSAYVLEWMLPSTPTSKPVLEPSVLEGWIPRPSQSRPTPLFFRLKVHRKSGKAAISGFLTPK
ncbi:hypothetical protein TNCT_421211 [Trichonephila clavata]|uniref:Uncharacterized protein n=1 Tax=Trichonephila clavata TaxID=2740835 RepID=A0A8X6IFU4_TRICU|nr:hypothetical protein TNCT_421211 [Trichonephila clavata]